MSIEAMKQALEALEILARYENPETRIQVRKPKDGGPIVTMYPHKVASDAAQSLRQAIEQAEKQEPEAAKRLDGYRELAQRVNTLETALRQAMEALEQYTDVVTSVNDPNSWVKVEDGGKPARKAITTAKQTLEDKS